MARGMEEATYRSGERLGKYELVKFLGSGGMGEVWLARDGFLDRLVAMKLLRLDRSTRADLRERMQREAQAGVRVDHPNVVKVLDGGLERDLIYIVMEYLENAKTLRDILWLARRGLPLQQALGVAYQVTDAVIALHAVDILHRDLKPENIMVVDRGRVKLIDFGLARIRTNVFRTTAQPKDGRPYGTLPYMAPEQLKEQRVTAACDVYAIGLLLWELLVGRHPVQRDMDELPDQQRLIYWQLHEMPPPLARVVPGTPEDFSAIVQRCCQKDPEARPSAWQLGQVLSGVIGRMRPPASPAPAAVRSAERAPAVTPARTPRHGTQPMLVHPGRLSPVPVDSRIHARVAPATAASHLTDTEPIRAVDAAVPPPRAKSSGGTTFADVDGGRDADAGSARGATPPPADVSARAQPKALDPARHPAPPPSPRGRAANRRASPSQGKIARRALPIVVSGVASGIFLGSLVVIAWARVGLLLAAGASAPLAASAATTTAIAARPDRPEASAAPPLASTTSSSVVLAPASSATLPAAPAAASPVAPTGSRAAARQGSPPKPAVSQPVESDLPFR